LVAEHLQRCVFVVDEDLRIVYINAAARAFFYEDYNVKVESTQRFLDFLPSGDSRHWRQFILEAFSGEIVSCDFNRGESDGFDQILKVEGKLLGGEESASDRVLMLFEDVTARRQYERELIQMHEALQEANRTRDTIFSILGHDLRSPIAQLNALLYFLRRAPERLSPEKIEEYVQNLDTSTRHLSQALDNILHWSSLHRNSIQPSLQMVNASAVAGESIGLLRLDAQRKGVVVEVDSPDPLEFPTDRDLLAYIMRNLLANAIKFSHRSGTVSLRQKIDPDGHYILEVSDQGMGMAKEHLSAVRDRERIVSTAGTSGEKGLGVGLSLCCEFCDLLDGALSIDSVPGQGTTVTVILPGDWPS
jgi:signal transduction histidine kinase